MSKELIKEEKIAIVKALVEKLQRELNCKIKFVDPIKEGTSVTVDGKKGIVESVNSPSSYNVKIDNKLNENVNFDSIKVSLNEMPLPTIDLVYAAVKKITSNYKMLRVTKAANKVVINGEIDVEQLQEIAGKLMAKGFVRGKNLDLDGVLYITYRDNPAAHWVYINKPVR